MTGLRLGLARLCALGLFGHSLAFAAELPKDLAPLLHKIEDRYNHAASLKLDFSESYAGSRRVAQTESGVLFLRKPGRMRWEYRSPAGKLFLSDGKETILYTPEDNTAHRSPLKQSEDMRAPLAFLLGKLDFAKEFRSFAARADGPDSWLVATPKNDNLAYTEVEFLATPDGQIHRVRFLLQDRSKLDFTFSAEQLNLPVAPALFTFQPPPGVQFVQAAE